MVRKFVAILAVLFGVAAMAMAQEVDSTFDLLRTRQDKKALTIFEQVLRKDPLNLAALWGKAEVLRRRRDYKHAETLLHQVLKKDPDHAQALISLSYIKLKQDDLNESLRLVNRAMSGSRGNKNNQAMAYVLLGMINAQRASKSGIIAKLRYGIGIKSCFLKAAKLAPQLPEARLALGTFYLTAPKIMGANLKRSIMELEEAVRIAPDFATANARLACAYQKNGELKKYNHYLKRTITLDPQNEVLKETTESR